MSSNDQDHPASESIKAFSKAVRVPVAVARDFFKMEASGGIVLVIASVLALIVANSPLYSSYNYFLNEVHFHIGLTNIAGNNKYDFDKSILHWINDGLMAIFFFLIGLEIKKEVMAGELSSRERALLPAIAAVGGMAVPALFYWYLNIGDPEAMRGWAIPAATDIAFALGVLSLLGNRVPTSLKALLLGIAVIDDMGAVLIIAIFFSKGISLGALYFAAACFVVLAIMNKRGVSSIAPYILVTILMWAGFLESGVHATIAGVVAAMFIPLKCSKDPSKSPVKDLEHGLHPWVAFLVLPIFGFANAGVPFAGLTIEDLFNPITFGIAGGLFIGKQIGVFGLIFLTIKMGLSPKPDGANWYQLYAVSLLCGIGFTMSLFIGGLAFDSYETQAYVRLGVLTGSIASAILAYTILRYGPTNQVIEAKPQKA
ncbi:MAG: Na+/H+ antiporter NhaA [Pseudomonadota bacterium]